jgi:hypothetical protein
MGRIIPYIMENKKCSPPPTRIYGECECECWNIEIIGIECESWNRCDIWPMYPKILSNIFMVVLNMGKSAIK